MDVFPQSAPAPEDSSLAGARFWPDVTAVAIVRDVWREHRIILALACGYIAVGGLVLRTLGRRWPIGLGSRWFWAVWLTVSAAWLLWQWLRSPKRLRAALEPRRVLGAAIVPVVAIPFQMTFQALKQSIGLVVGFTWDPMLHRVDAALHGGAAWLWTRPIVESRALLWIDRLYEIWFLLLFGFVLWLSWTARRRLRQRAMIAFLLLWMIGGTVVAWAVASGGPCFYARLVTPAEPSYAALEAELHGHGGLWAVYNQEGLWTLRQHDEWGMFAGISAFPSMHVGFAALLALVAWSAGRALGVVLAGNALLLQIGSVALGWHYAIDGYAGALVAGACWMIAGRMTSWPMRPTSDRRRLVGTDLHHDRYP